MPPGSSVWEDVTPGEVGDLGLLGARGRKSLRTPRFTFTCTQTYRTHPSSPYFYLTSCSRNWPAGQELHLQMEKTEGSDGLSESWLSRLPPGRILVKYEPDILKWPESPTVINAVFHDCFWNKIRIWCRSSSAYPLLFTESLRSSYLLVLLYNPINPLKESLHCQNSLKI